MALEGGSLSVAGANKGPTDQGWDSSSKYSICPVFSLCGTGRGQKSKYWLHTRRSMSLM